MFSIRVAHTAEQRTGAFGVRVSGPEGEARALPTSPAVLRRVRGDRWVFELPAPSPIRLSRISAARAPSACSGGPGRRARTDRSSPASRRANPSRTGSDRRRRLLWVVGADRLSRRARMRTLAEAIAAGGLITYDQHAVGWRAVRRGDGEGTGQGGITRDTFAGNPVNEECRALEAAVGARQRHHRPR
jgi:hypothetical protein